METPTSTTDLLTAARDFVPVLRARSDEIEATRHLPQDLARAFADAGFFITLIPEAYGGLEVDPVLYLEIIETLSQGDASAGWCAMIGSTTGLAAAYMPEATAREVFAPEKGNIVVGVFAPRGKAIPENGGYRVSGQWQWGSGSRNANWIAGGCVTVRDGEPERMPNGLPLSRMMFLPAEEVELLDTWNVSGLCGTGSTDFAIDDRFVPADRAVGIVTDAHIERPLYYFPLFSLLSAGVSTVCLGIARSAIDELVSFASKKTPEGSFKPLAMRQETQMAVARAESQLRSAKAWLKETMSVAWDAACADGDLSLELRRDLRLAAVNATQASVQAVDIVYGLAGGTSVYRRSPLQRHFRDIHVATQHLLVGTSTLEQAGRLFLGLESDTSTF